MARFLTHSFIARTAAVVIGLVVAAAVLRSFDARSVLAAMSPIGVWGFLLVIAAQLALYAPLGLAWWVVALEQPIARVGVFVWSSLMAEAATNILPFSQLGGAVIASRAAALGGTPTETALGSNVVDVTMEILAQLVFTLVGVALLVRRLGFGAQDDRLVGALVAGAFLVAILIAGFMATQKRVLMLLDRLLRRVAPSLGGDTTALAQVIGAAYGQRRRLWGCFGLHVFAWFATAAGAWLILRLIGRPLPMLSVAAIESLVFGARNAAFFVPGGLGVQEGAYALLGPLFGLPAEAALALSLLKRARDLSIGVPALLVWQYVEMRHTFRRRPARTASTSDDG
jgi:putative membrane protein